MAQWTLRRYKPLVVAVTGSVGKTSTKEAIFAVLKSQYHDRVRRTTMNLNTEIGVPLAILGIRGGGKNPLAWAFHLLKGFFAVVWSPSHPEVLILEMGADRPGDIRYLAQLAPPRIAVVTAIGEIPAHVEFFAGPKTLAREKAKLLEALPEDGWAMLNFDDLTVLEMRERKEMRVLTFGFGESADVRATAYEIRTGVDAGREIPEGINFKLEYRGTIVPVRLHGMFGKGAAYAALAAAAVGLALKMHLVEISEALSDIQPVPGRLCLVNGVKHSLILDDTYNAAPQAVVEALDTLAEFPARRRIAVLGDMLELGKYTEAAHRTMGERAARVADFFVTVGERMRFAGHEAIARGMDESRVHMFSTTQEAGKWLQDKIMEGDVVLVKGARAMRMERVVEELHAA